MPTTLKQVADSLGLAQTTVSQVLRGKGSFPPATRERILQRARELHYRPNALAQSMRGGRTGLIGLVYTAEGVRGNLPVQLLTQLERELSRRSYGLMVSELPNLRLAEQGVVSRFMRHWMTDGLLVNHQLDVDPGTAEQVERDGVPAVWINSRQKANCVYFDDYDASRIATMHLLQLGHRQIAYADYSHPRRMLEGVAEHYSVVDRYGGYRDAMVQAGLAPRMIVHEEGSVPGDQRYAYSVDLLQRPDRPTALICYGPTTLTPLLFAAARLGFPIPQELSIVHFSQNTDPLMDLCVTTMHTEARHLATAAVGQLLGRLEAATSEEQTRPAVAVPVRMVEGQTTSPPARSGNR